MKSVLIIAYQFPPMGGSGVQRTTKFVKHLNKFNYKPIVFTRDEKNIGLLDETLLLDIPKNTKIYRNKSYDFSEGKGILSVAGKVLGRKILVPDSARIWELNSHSKVLDIIKKENISIIYSTSFPYSDHLLGLFIKKTLGDKIKWIVDFRDEWSNNPYTLDNPHSSKRMKMEILMEKKVLLNCDFAIANTPVMRKNFINIHKLSKEKSNNFFVIPNGYDVDDFHDLDKNLPCNDKFTICYTGALYGRRKPDYFFKSISELILENKIDKNKLQINFIGNYKINELRQNINKFNILDVVKIYNYMPHKEAIQFLLKSDALLLIEGGGIGSDAFYTGKIFEYMNTNRPVIGILPVGCAMDLVYETNIGLVSEFDDIKKTKENIFSLYQNWVKKENNFSPKLEEIKKYDRITLTKKLSEIFDKC